MEVCVPSMLLYGLLAAAVGERFARRDGLVSLVRGSQSSQDGSSKEK